MNFQIDIRDIPLLAGESVVIRPYRREDIDALYEAVRESVPELGIWMPWCGVDYSRGDSEQWVNSRPEAWRGGDEFSFAVVERESGRFAGGCGLNRLDRENRFANLGYWIRSDMAARGYASEAARLLARFAFGTAKLHRIEIVMAVENIASRRVAEKIGCVREGVLRNRLSLHGRSHDAYCYSLIPADM